MNRQINYILSAAFYLFVLGVIVLSVSKFPFSPQKGKDIVILSVNYQKPELSEVALRGKALFMSKCASCHALFKAMVGPSLLGFTSREPRTNRQNVYGWIHNPEVFLKKNDYTRQLRESFGGNLMTAFPDLKNEEIDAICVFLEEAEEAQNQPLATSRK